MKTAFFPVLGRTGNLLFIYAHARAWCEQNGYELSMDPWIGEKIFQIPEAIRPSQHKPDKVFPEAYYQDQASLIYTRKQVKEWFMFKPEILERLRVLDKTKPDVVLNLRQGEDYTAAGLVTLSTDSYMDACRNAGYDPNSERVLIERDITPTRLHGFDGDMSAGGQGVTMVGLPSFYRLMTAPVLFRANSTFSWWAATLAENQKVYSPIITGVPGGHRFAYCANFVEGNWPQMTTSPINTDLHLKEGE